MSGVRVKEEEKKRRVDTVDEARGWNVPELACEEKVLSSHQ